MQKSDYLPNIRRLYKPDPGHTLFDCDLSGADAQVVAWEAGDEDLKATFRSGAKIHIKNFEDMFEKKFDPERDKRVIPAGWNYTPYDSMKRFVHATNYYASPRTIAVTLGWKVAQAKAYQGKWFRMHPAIHEWHKRTDTQLQTTRTIRNQFGYRIVYFDRPDALLPEALAWVPQSTVGILCAKGAIALRKYVSWANLRMQIHDSLVFQIPNHRVEPSGVEEILNVLKIAVPYKDPLYIPWSVAASAQSWADCKPLKW